MLHPTTWYIKLITERLFPLRLFRLFIALMVYSHWLGPELGLGQGLGPGRMGRMVLIRTFHTAPEQGQGRAPGTFSGPEQ